METLFSLELDFNQSHGSYLVDRSSGEKYLDFFSMYSSLPLGYNHPVFDSSFNQAVLPLTRLRFSTNAYHCEIIEQFIERFSKTVFSNAIHFCCTGALAVESALKAAIDYKKVASPVVLSVENSFHGVNSWGFTTSRVGKTASRLKGMPELDWPKLTLDGIIEYLQTGATESIVAVIIEPVQCTNGDIYLDRDKLFTIHQLCGKLDICLIFDEIQTGYGTTGKMWYYEHLGIQPDVLVFGKKAQVCGIVLSEKYADILNLDEKKLQVTFDGDLIDILRSEYVLKAIEHFDLLNRVSEGSALMGELISSHVMNYRSVGFLMAFDFETSRQRDQFVNSCYDNKLIINKAGEVTVRLRPNLAANASEIEAAAAVMKKFL